jgi:chorismate mutase/prephenate dehydrogenase
VRVNLSAPNTDEDSGDGQRQENASKNVSESQLVAYRLEMDRITRSILDLVLERQKISALIAEKKVLLGQKIENVEAEKKIIASAKDHAKNIGLDAEQVEPIVRTLIGASKLHQAELVFGSQVRANLTRNGIASVTIVGAGRMGGWFARYFKRMGVKVRIFDRDFSKAERKARDIGCEILNDGDYLSTIADFSDLIVLAIPIDDVPKEVERLLELSKNRSSPLRDKEARVAKPLRVIEISSIKSRIASAGFRDLGMEKVVVGGGGGSRTIEGLLEIYSIHPLFGETAGYFEKNSIIVISTIADGDPRLIGELFPQFNLVDMDWRTHDEIMGWVLTAPHTLALVFADILSKLDSEKRKIIVGLGAPSFDHMLKLARRVLGENPNVYFQIERLNPFAERVLSDIISIASEVHSATKDRASFEQLFEKGRKVIKEEEVG